VQITISANAALERAECFRELTVPSAVAIAPRLLQFTSSTSSALHSLNQSKMSRPAQRTAGASRQTVQPFRELLNGDCAALQLYINEGGCVEAREKVPPRKALLHQACELPAEAARQLVEAGADVNAAADASVTSTPLMSAQSADLAKLLLDSGADVELTDDRGRNALRIACEKANIDSTKLFLKRSSPAAIMQAASDGTSPLCVAMNAGSEALALLVLAAHPADYDANRC
jgi:Ankyrin repeats (3 copies)